MFVDLRDAVILSNPLPCRNIRNILTNGCKLICFKESSLMGVNEVFKKDNHNKHGRVFKNTI